MIVLKGKADHVSREQVRAFLIATLAVMGYHNRGADRLLFVTIRRDLADMGTCLFNRIELNASLNPEEMLTTCVHEVIHACIEFPEGTKEKCTTTLCARIKPDVAALAQILLDGTYRRAAYFAHTKIQYPAPAGDFYDPAEDAPLGIETRYLKGP